MAVLRCRIAPRPVHHMPSTRRAWEYLLHPELRPPQAWPSDGRTEGICALGFELGGCTPDGLGAFVQDQLQAWGKALRDAGMTPE